MDAKTINWNCLSYSQKAKLINQARNHLHQQVSEERFYRLIADIYQIEADINDTLVSGDFQLPEIFRDILL
jgi:hypothetical protein